MFVVDQEIIWLEEECKRAKFSLMNCSVISLSCIVFVYLLDVNDLDGGIFCSLRKLPTNF